MELLAVFLIVLGVGLLLWCLFGLLLVPVFGPDMVTLCFAKGDGLMLEHRVRSYGWLREGAWNSSRLVIVDRGLTAKGRDLAKRLSEQYGWVWLYDGQLPTFLEE